MILMLTTVTAVPLLICFTIPFSLIGLCIVYKIGGEVNEKDMNSPKR